MNKLSGYKEFTAASGEKIEVKFCNGSTEIYSELTGIKTLAEIDESLSFKMVPKLDGLGQPVLGEDNQPVLVPDISTAYLKSLRLWIYAAALYAARVQNKPVTFNEWSPTEWMEEFGAVAFLSMIDQNEEGPKKNEPTPQTLEPQPLQ